MSKRTQQLYICDLCDYSSYYKGNYKLHLQSLKHVNNSGGYTEGMPEVDIGTADGGTDTVGAVGPNDFHCEFCNYITNYKKDYTRHMSSKKHETNVLIVKNKMQPNQCNNCKKIYSSHKNLWRHKRQCKKMGASPLVNINIASDDDTDEDEEYCSEIQQEQTPPPGGFAITPELLLEVLKQNKELQNVLIEQHRSVSTINTNNIGNTNNSHNSTVNKTFNIQFFLNEHCKNAIDIQQFVRMLDYSTANLEKNMKLGYTGGITKMITDGIQILPVEERPLHCSDEKREKIYIRDNGTWISGNESKERLQQVIADIANNNYNTFRRWVAENPTCQKLDTPAYQKFVTIYNGVIGSRTDEEEAKHVKKILSNIIDEITIEKDKYLI